jgi:hypothetical protein
MAGIEKTLTVEVVVQFEWPRSRPPSLNGRSPASELRVALPQPGRQETIQAPLLGRSDVGSIQQAAIQFAAMNIDSSSKSVGGDAEDRYRSKVARMRGG